MPTRRRQKISTTIAPENQKFLRALIRTGKAANLAEAVDRECRSLGAPQLGLGSSACAPARRDLDRLFKRTSSSALDLDCIDRSTESLRPLGDRADVAVCVANHGKALPR
jgi:hypothetical protein